MSNTTLPIELKCALEEFGKHTTWQSTDAGLNPAELMQRQTQIISENIMHDYPAEADMLEQMQPVLTAIANLTR